MKLPVLVLAAVVVSTAGSSSAFAQAYYYGQVPPSYYGPLPSNPPPEWLAEGRSAADWDRYRYDYSGTRGRMGLGASPFHPEGPGNFSTPGR